MLDNVIEVETHMATAALARDSQGPTLIVIAIDAFLRAPVHDLGDRCLVRAFADDIAIILGRIWIDGPVAAFLFAEIARISNLKSKPRKCAIIPMWPIFWYALHGFSKQRFLSGGEFLCDASGRGRVQCVRDLSPGLRAAALLCNFIAISVLGIVLQLVEPTADLLKTERAMLRKLVVGQGNWLPPKYEFNLDRLGAAEVSSGNQRPAEASRGRQGPAETSRGQQELSRSRHRAAETSREQQQSGRHQQRAAETSPGRMTAAETSREQQRAAETAAESRSAGEGGDKPTEAAAETDAELEKKRKRTEDGKDNEQTKKQKSQENEEGDAATAPGEGQEAKGAKPPKQKKFHALKDPPAIFPHVQTLYNAFWDPSKPTEVLREALQKVVETRQTILTETEEIAKREDIHAGARRRSLCRVIYDRLNCAQGQAPVSQLAADPTVQVLRKGVAKNMKQFVDHHPDWFLFGEGKSNNGKSQPTLYISPGRQHMKGPPLDEATRQYRTEMLLFKMGELLEAQGGSLPVSKLGQDERPFELRQLLNPWHPALGRLALASVVDDGGRGPAPLGGGSRSLANRWGKAAPTAPSGFKG
ncbi:unnamed protein product [Prorocentrum cordatum]|uniref:Reverse transcriptase domain-containing protein n=1 Tax=Prorocentrum cordatum TaxID=2364126 RepID=A0ABN9QRW1_9DINO|nr:unnamed protein product [Polarella glacialis]